MELSYFFYLLRKRMSNVIEASILKGIYKGEDVLISRINLVANDIPFHYNK